VLVHRASWHFPIVAVFRLVFGWLAVGFLWRCLLLLGLFCVDPSDIDRLECDDWIGGGFVVCWDGIRDAPCGIAEVGVVVALGLVRLVVVG